MIKLNLFKKEGVYTNLLIGTLEQGKTNMPLYNETFTLWKGVDNTIEFSIRNHDRKSVDMSDGILTFTMINQKTRQTYIKELETIDSALGRYKVVIKRKELNDYDCGTFVGHVSVLKDGTEELLYTGVDWYPFFNVNIEPNKLEVITETKTFDMSSMNRSIIDDKEDGKQYECFMSSMIKSDVTPYHTFIMKLKNFHGEIIIQGSLMDTPQNDMEDWFDISTFENKNYDSEDFKKITDTILLSSVLNSLWVRVIFKCPFDSDSKIEEISYRN